MFGVGMLAHVVFRLNEFDTLPVYHCIFHVRKEDPLELVPFDWNRKIDC